MLNRASELSLTKCIKCPVICQKKLKTSGYADKDGHGVTAPAPGLDAVHAGVPSPHRFWEAGVAQLSPSGSTEGLPAAAPLAAATRMVPLPQLPGESEDLETWLRSHIHHTQANDGWAAYQKKVIDWCAPFWRPEIVSDYDVLLDRDLWEAWSQEMLFDHATGRSTSPASKSSTTP